MSPPPNHPELVTLRQPLVPPSHGVHDTFVAEENKHVEAGQRAYTYRPLINPNVYDKDVLNQIILAIELDNKPLLKTALIALARRPQPLTMEDADRLGLDIVLLMASVRESIVAADDGTAVAGRRNAEGVDFEPMIHQVFRERLGMGTSAASGDRRMAVGRINREELDFGPMIEEIFQEYLANDHSNSS
ncbi:hypothetical protein CONPUDRAFT_75430 [Coniophora puteana RWD-64-598 SS2]|uniref:Uncharacterized protein n=1 Tax=Coniophora puteana (strain RWD-64-598) TaxID=741705 RepID=A0A5M3MEV8_CONPW|nr:uncharacterized protein CONPUDRAFT_75430 [Coniophora puteana RWD-64-598 SS2]EIW77577.1 hypothetical protein CONPUDRAFT_75430 [Coniophora puteana RWD-64-598 SS2]